MTRFTKYVAVVATCCAGALIRNDVPVRAEKVIVSELVDDIVPSDIATGGNCAQGCTREVHATAYVMGSPDTTTCELETVTPFDSTPDEPGLLRASIYCEDSDGTMIRQGTLPCIFEVCVDFRWETKSGQEEGELVYDVVIYRDSRPYGAHTVYVDLSVSVDPTASAAAVTTCEFQETCDIKNCTGSEAYMAEMILTDSYGDGWLGGVSGTFNTFSLKAVGTNTTMTTGTLAESHFHADVRECLADGNYIFSTTADKAFADEIGWQVCNVYGGAGEGVTFTIENGECTHSTFIERATAEETEDAEASYCTLPASSSDSDYRASTCTSLSEGLDIDGVGLFYDDRCNSADLSGCGGRSIAACRLCFFDKPRWLQHYPTARIPDWELCPCCVATVMQEVCMTESGDSGSDTGIIIGVTVGLVGLMAVACCLSCAFGPTIVRIFRRLRRQREDKDMDNIAFDHGESAFPDSPSHGSLVIARAHTGHRLAKSGSFSIPRFDSNAVMASALSGGAAIREEPEKERINSSSTTPISTESRKSPISFPRSTVLAEQLVSSGYTASDAGHVRSPSAGYELCHSGKYPDLAGADPYAVETGTSRRNMS